MVSRLQKEHLFTPTPGRFHPGPVFCLLLGVSSDYAQPITVQVTEVTCPVIGRAQPELTPSKRQKTGPGFQGFVKENHMKNAARLKGSLLVYANKLE